MKLNLDQIIPDAYVGREQAYIKHLLLKGYLERLLYIVGYHAHALGQGEVVFVDCFAGPWQDDSADLSATSIGISLELLSQVKDALAKVGKVVRFKAIYIEKNKHAFARLENFLRSNTPDGIHTQCFPGDFVDRIPDLLKEIPSSSFAFFFIDPKGWAVVKPEVLSPLLSRPRSEFLINLMYDFANRVVSMARQRETVAELFGKYISIDELPQDPTARELYLLKLYRVAITEKAKSHGNRAMTSYVPVLDPTADRTKYHLIYLTRHPKGIIEFMEQSEQLAPVQNTVRAAAKFEKQKKDSGSGDLFGFDADLLPTVASDTERMQMLEELWLSKFSNSTLSVTIDVFASLLSESDCFPSEIQNALRSLINKGLVVNTDAKDIRRRTRNVVNFEKKELLRCTS